MEISNDAKTISQYTGTRADAVQRFIDTNRLDAAALTKHVVKGKYPERSAFAGAIAGKPGNRFEKELIKRFQLNEATLEEAIVVDLKQIARNMVRDYFSTSGPMGPTIRNAGKELNRFRAEMEQQIAGAMKGVIRRWGRGNFFTGDPSKIWADPDLKQMKPATNENTLGTSAKMKRIRKLLEVYVRQELKSISNKKSGTVK